MAEHDMFKIAIKGPGLSFDQPVDKAVATKIISFVMTGSALLDGGGSGAGGGGAAGAGSGGTVNASGQTIKQFVTSKRPQTQYERVACLAYYLTHVSSTPKFKTRAITKANTDAAGPKITNPSQTVADTTRTYGYLSNAGKGTKQITALGEAVVDALPSREALAAAVADHKPKRKKPRRSARKKK